MRILITGASGFIGQHLVRALKAGPHEVIAASHKPHRLAGALEDVRVVELDFARLRNVDDCLALLDGIDVVINTVGLIHETRRQSFEQIHHLAPCILFRACRLAGVGKVIQLSALGADTGAVSDYHLSKKAADDCLKKLDIDWLIIKPSLVYGPGGKSAVLFKALSVLPLIPLIDGGTQRVQPIHIDDLIRLITKLLSPEAPTHIEIEGVGPQPVSFRKMLCLYRHWLGEKAGIFLSLPGSLALLAGRIAEVAGSGLVSEATIRMLQRESCGDPTTLSRITGIEPMSLETALAATPSQQADRWHAGLYFLAPLLRITIGLLWLFTGITSAFLFPIEQSLILLAEVGVTGPSALVALYGAAALDSVLGVATLLRYRIHLVGWLQISLILAYTILISMGPSELWLHPFGPISKNIPLLVATFIMLVLEKK